MIVALAMAGTDIRTGAGRPDMRTGPDAVTIKPAARADGCNMRPGMHTMIANTGTGTHHRPDMAACSDAMLANARTRTCTENMSARANTMLVDAHIRANAQHIDTEINGIGARCEQRRQQGHGANSGSKMFHKRNPSGALHGNARQVWKFPATPVSPWAA